MRVLSVCGVSLSGKTTTIEHISLGHYYPLPVLVEARTYKEFTVTLMRRSLEEAKVLAEDMLDWRISVDIGETAELAGKQVEFLEYNPEALVVRAVVAVVEDIAEQRMVMPNY